MSLAIRGRNGGGRRGRPRDDIEDIIHAVTGRRPAENAGNLFFSPWTVKAGKRSGIMRPPSSPVSDHRVSIICNFIYK